MMLLIAKKSCTITRGKSLNKKNHPRRALTDSFNSFCCPTRASFADHTSSKALQASSTATTFSWHWDCFLDNLLSTLIMSTWSFPTALSRFSFFFPLQIFYCGEVYIVVLFGLKFRNYSFFCLRNTTVAKPKPNPPPKKKKN